MPNQIIVDNGNDSILSPAYSLNGDDIISTGAGDDVIDALDGVDLINAGSGDDSIGAGWGTNVVFGGAGNDVLVLYGRQSDYHLVFFNGGVFAFALDGSQSVVGSLVENIYFTDTQQTLNIGGDTSASGATSYSVETVSVMAAGDTGIATGWDDDYIFGNSTDNSINAGWGTNMVFGGAGNDALVLDGSSSDYDLEFSNGFVVAVAKNGTQHTTAASIESVYFTTTGETIATGQGFAATQGNDTLNGTAGNDFIDGLGGDDTIVGGAGDDTLLGSGGNDVINGGWGVNTVNGGDGSDTLVLDGDKNSYSYQFSDGALIATATSGVQTTTASAIEAVYFTDTQETISIDLWPDGGRFSIVGGAGDDTLFGTSTNDLLDGGAGDDIHYGYEGSNTFFSSLGNDVFHGGSGYDQVDYDGALSDYAFTQNGDGSVTVSNATYGTDTLYGIEGFWLRGESTWYSMADALSGSTSVDPSWDGPFSSSDYESVLDLSMQFFYAQYLGDLPSDFPLSWRGDSFVDDGLRQTPLDGPGQDSNVGVDLSGGWKDAGDNIKFGFPMAFAATTLAWGAIEFEDGYHRSGAYAEVVDHLGWVMDYLLRAYDDNGTADVSDDVLYYQVGSPSVEHWSYWQAPEDAPSDMPRPVYYVDKDTPGSDVAAETAAAMASASIVMNNVGETALASQLLQQAEKLYLFAETYQGLYPADPVGAYYQSYEYEDELAWGALWLYKATGNQGYLSKAQTYEYPLFYNMDKKFSWNDKHFGVAAMLAEETGNQFFFDTLDDHHDTVAGMNGVNATTTNDGLAVLSNWGSNKYAANAALIELQYARILNDRNAPGDAQKIAQILDFSSDQIDFMLGDNSDGQSYVVGFGSNYPINPHHQGASGMNGFGHGPGQSWSDESNVHTLFGALVGGPDENGVWIDDREDYQASEVANDYNSGFATALAGLIEFSDYEYI